MRVAEMKERPDFRLMRQTDIQSFYHMQMPRWLFTHPDYAGLSLEAKVTYTFLLNRFQLSRVNGWVNELGEVFIIFPREELAREMQISYRKAISSFQELAGAKLIWEKRCGRGDANQIYLARVDESVAMEEYESAPFLSARGGNETNSGGAGTAEKSTRAKSAKSRSAKSAGLEVPDPQVKKCENGRFGNAETAGPEVPNPHPSNTYRSNTYKSHIEVSQSVGPADRQADDENELLDILDACELYCFEPETAKVFENAVERLFYSDSFRIGSATLPRSRIRAKLHLLDGMILRDAESKLHANLDSRVKNSTAYTMATLMNCIAESESDLMVDPYLNSLRAPPGGR